VGLPTSKPSASCRRSLLSLVWFTCSIIGLGLLFSAAVKPWLALSWWQVFRRCASVAAAVTLWWFLRRVDRLPVRALGLGPWASGKRQLAGGIALGVAAVAVMAAGYLAAGIWRIDIHPDTARVWRTVIGFLPAAGLVAVLEELVFRGYILQRLLPCSRALAVVGSSVAYALVHLRPPVEWPGSGLEIVGLFILGCVLALSYLKTRQLYAAIGLHAVLAYAARVNKLLVEAPDQSLIWLIGTSRLINGVLTWVMLIGVGWLLARRMRVSA